jgi:hypothetical protein
LETRASDSALQWDVGGVSTFIPPSGKRAGSPLIERAAPWRTTTVSPAPGKSTPIGHSSTRSARPKASSSGGGAATTPCVPTVRWAIDPRPRDTRVPHAHPAAAPDAGVRSRLGPRSIIAGRPLNGGRPDGRMSSVQEIAYPRLKRQPTPPQVRTASSVRLRPPRTFGVFVFDHPLPACT